MSTKQQLPVPNNQQPQKCKTCKTFYGTPERDGLCSGCFNKITNKKPEVKPAVKQQKVEIKEQQKKQDPDRPIQQNKKKCWECEKKIGLLGIQCRCGYIFCNTHRLPQDHHCDFNHLQAAKRKLSKQITKIDHLKMERLDSR